ncbi:hypothetical protein PtB15_14B474 [Puccinia triticina]|nr:hypothetical protein PtB15_14B474 [Puccinia triticina]
MYPLQLRDRHLSVYLLVLWSNLAVLATSPENPNTLRSEIPYTTTDLLAASSGPGEFMGEEPTHRFPILESECTSGPFLQDLPQAKLAVSIGPSRQPYPSSHQVGRISASSNPRIRVAPDDIGIGHLRGTPRRQTGDKLSAIINNVRWSKTRARTLIEVAELLQQYQPEPSHRSYISPSGKIMIPFLNDRRREFDEALTTVDFDGLPHSTIVRLDRTTHPSLPKVFPKIQSDQLKYIY